MMYLELESRDVDRAILNLMVLLSPPGASAFLGAEIGPWLAKRAGERFSGEGDDVFGAWRPLKPATVAIRSEQGFGGDHPINRRTGELEDWVVRGGWDTDPEALGASLTYPKSLPVGELRDKVDTAQLGRDEPYTLPRPVLGINETDLTFLTTAYAFAVETALK